MINYLTSSFLYTKLANLILWFYSDVKLGIGYSVIFVLGALLLPEPTYTGPENVSGLEPEGNVKLVLKFITLGRLLQNSQQPR